MRHWSDYGNGTGWSLLNQMSQSNQINMVSNQNARWELLYLRDNLVFRGDKQQLNCVKNKRSQLYNCCTSVVQTLCKTYVYRQNLTCNKMHWHHLWAKRPWGSFKSDLCIVFMQMQHKHISLYLKIYWGVNVVELGSGGRSTQIKYLSKSTDTYKILLQ